MGRASTPAEMVARPLHAAFSAAVQPRAIRREGRIVAIYVVAHWRGRNIFIPGYEANVRG